jgi:porphobilinogen synthase
VIPHRPRRWRLSPALRALVRETTVTPSNLIAPLFVHESADVPRPVGSMPGVFQYPVSAVAGVARTLAAAGVAGVILFGLPRRKDADGSGAWAADGGVQQAVAALKAAAPSLVVITDVCLCEYTDHGHCGLVNGIGRHNDPTLPVGYVLNDPTLELLGRVAVSHVRAGADIVAPSAMLDGMVGAVRTALDAEGYTHVPLLSYSAKYASAFYGPFRDAADAAPQWGDRSTHQMDPANLREAMREHALDLAQGADALMVKPALAHLDIIRATRDRYPDIPLAAYNVSGEYAMVKAAAANGWLDERRSTLEILTAIRRAGADTILTYHALDAARWLVE